MINKIHLAIFLSSIFTLVCCTPEEQAMNNPDLLFSNSIRLSVPPYTYSGKNNLIYTISGDTNYFYDYPDTIDGMPFMQWDTFNIYLLTCAIFTNPIIEQGGNIINGNDMIWQWHKGMADGKTGRVQYLQGRNVTNSVVDYDNLPIPLSTGNYYWAVWGWNTSGTQILFSTRQMKLYVIN